jgi:predicted aldo/keto reductase-like oxidoreductase
VDYFDYYLCHSISRQYVFQNLYLDEGVLDFLLEQKRAGKIRQLGFSFHGDLALFEWLLALPIEWDFVQIQMNWLDWKDNVRQAETLYTMLAERKIPVIVMEPIRGGSLIDVPFAVKELMQQSDAELSPAAWALKFCATYPYVLTVLSGMSKIEHVVENCQTFTDFKPLSDEQMEMLHLAADLYRNNSRIGCTDCLYCMPCPYGLDIPSIFAHYNRCLDEGRMPQNEMDEDYKQQRREFLIGLERGVPKLRQADHCTGCRECEHHCPQRIRISREMRKIDEFVQKLLGDGRI